MRSAADFREMARISLRGNWLIAVLVGLAAALLCGTDGNILNFEVQRTVDSAELGVDLAGITVYSSHISFLDGVFDSTLVLFVIAAIVIFAVQLILGSIVGVGYARFNLDLVDGKEVSAKTLFEYLPQWKTMVIAGLLQMIYILGWTLLFIIPGIIAAYRYAMTNYILAENPELTASEAINQSKELMDGNKWRLFCLEFSFIGWAILSVLTMGIGYLWLNPYQYAASAAFYRDVTAPMADTESEEETEEPEE